MISLQISIRGIVQGVGFRPFVYTLAQNKNLSGKVWNTSSGVEILIKGEPEFVNSFLDTLLKNPPPLARIDKFEFHPTETEIQSGFEVIESQSDSNAFVPISPDICICEDCRKELFDPNNRRYGYPFINCTNCGPRLTIIKDIPYDRPNTTMAGFPLCPECLAEYQNPFDRRFHAQPVACSKCGPQLAFHVIGKQDQSGEEALQAARRGLKNGMILAIKGLGGYHIACDASNYTVIEKLIQRKRRSEKPLALMAFSEDVIKKYCVITPFESELLNSPQHPIVLLQKREDCTLPDILAHKQNHLGFMLPYTPMHLLLLEPATDYPEVLMMTSGNISEEPIAYEDKDAFLRLSGLVDGFLTHNREIHTRVDDSVVRSFENQLFPIRLSRGYAPDSIILPKNVPEMLSCGAELKNTFALSKENYAFISHHIGDLENFETLEAFEEGINHFQRLFRVNPELIAADLHPDYLSSKYAMHRSENEGIPLVKVQHHHAHLAACLADNHWVSDEPAIGIILDGTGYGSDGIIWGGEFLLGSYLNFSRQLHLSPVPLPGGDSSIKNISKIGISYLLSSDVQGEMDLPPFAQYNAESRKVIIRQIEKRINSPLTSSMGRLFDAVASIIDLRQEVSYEAQAAIELENCCDPFETSRYAFQIVDGVILTNSIIREIVADIRNKTKKSIISARFHNTIAQMCLDASLYIRNESRITTAALSGGVWQNITLLKKTKPLLEKYGFKVLLHHQVPTNDGGISLGQLLVAGNTFNL